MKKVLKFFGRLTALILAIVLLAAIVLCVIPLTERVDKAPAAGAGSWMADVPDEVFLSEMTIPGAHDAASLWPQLAFVTKCQALDIAQQLNIGVRYLDIRLGEDGDNLLLFHGFTKCRTAPLPWADVLTLSDVLAQCTAFLDAHPTETILFAVKHEHGDLPDAEFDAMVQRYVEADPDHWLITNEMPTLGDARGKLVLLRRYEGAGLALNWADQGGHDDVTQSIVAEPNGSYTLWVQDRFCYGAEDKWTAFTAGQRMMETDGENAAIHFLSTKGTLPQGHPWYFAQKLNPRLLDYDRGELSGWIVVDFVTPELAKTIYDCN